MTYLYSIILVTTILVSVDSSWAGTAPRTIAHSSPVVIHPFTKNQDGSPKHLLRTHKTVHQDDEERAGLEKLAGIAKSGTKKLIESAKLNLDLLAGTNGVGVLNTLKLRVLKSPKLRTLTEYISKLNKKYPNKKISLIGTLSVCYGDDAVARALVSAQRRSNSPPELVILATHMRADQVSAWLNSGQSVDDVFKLLKLSDAGFDALISRKLIVLDDYIKYFKNRGKSGDETLLKALTTGFGGESNFAAFLHVARDHHATRTKANELETAKFQQWLDEGFDSVSVLIKKFNVDQATTTDTQKSIATQFEAFRHKALNVGPNVFKANGCALAFFTAFCMTRFVR